MPPRAMHQLSASHRSLSLPVAARQVVGDEADAEANQPGLISILDATTTFPPSVVVGKQVLSASVPRVKCHPTLPIPSPPAPCEGYSDPSHLTPKPTPPPPADCTSIPSFIGISDLSVSLVPLALVKLGCQPIFIEVRSSTFTAHTQRVFVSKDATGSSVNGGMLRAKWTTGWVVPIPALPKNTTPESFPSGLNRAKLEICLKVDRTCEDAKVLSTVTVPFGSLAWQDTPRKYDFELSGLGVLSVTLKMGFEKKRPDHSHQQHNPYQWQPTPFDPSGSREDCNSNTNPDDRDSHSPKSGNPRRSSDRASGLFSRLCHLSRLWQRRGAVVTDSNSSSLSPVRSMISETASLPVMTSQISLGPSGSAVSSPSMSPKRTSRKKARVVAPTEQQPFQGNPIFSTK